MTKRGRVLRVPGEGPGLVIVEGQQFWFVMDSIWKSTVPPAAGLIVEVGLDGNSQLIAIEAVVGVRADQRNEVNSRKAKAVQIVSRLIGRCGIMNLVAVSALAVAWCCVTNVSLQAPLVGRLDFTFWQVLGLLNAGSSFQAVNLRNGIDGVGYYGWLAAVALSGPFLYSLWKDRRARIGGLAPLLFTIIIGLMARSWMQNALAGSFETYADLGRGMQPDVSKVVSLGAGAYLSIIASLYFGIVAVGQFFSERSGGSNASAGTKRVAA